MLDPGNADARLALIAFNPPYRRWQEREAQLRGDPRFASLRARTGLEDCWRKSGTMLDFRRS